jgi:PilZ domain
MGQPEDERRKKQRFPLKLPVIVSFEGGSEIRGVSRDVSSVGVFFYVDYWPPGVSIIEFKMILPREITQSDNMRALCTGRVVRVEMGSETTQTGVAATIDGYSLR